MEALEPGVKVDVIAYKIGFRDAALQHLLPEMSEAHVAGAAARVGDDHDLLYAKLINRDDETAHGRIPRRRDDCTGILDDLGIPVLQAQRFLKKH